MDLAHTQRAPSPALKSSIPPFLRLSREIRDLIYLTVLESTDDAPSTPASCGPRLDLGYQGHKGSDWADPCTYKQPPLDFGTLSQWNRYSETPVYVNSRSLLLVNRQIHAEMKEAISCFKVPHGLKYILDCIIENEFLVYPTWLYVPAVSSRVDIVETQIRACGDWLEKKRSGWRAGCGGFSHLIWDLLELLQRFLVRGPDFLSQPKEGGVKVGVLVLNILTPEEPEGGFLPIENFIYGNEREHGLIHPESIAQMLDMHMNTLLRYACGGVKERERITYHVMKLGEFLERIEIRVDGNERSSWDLGKLVYTPPVR
ncbi:hypothetical protein BKA65DRAFT_302956 [Rhexocercosporidium sp. MPI-PUGE-AT-0058]|nr:hypothetical protein BKA65DRAFT_302956 [Rhexocercosporidium sp. MPI-PUGE-AT-0058]